MCSGSYDQSLELLAEGTDARSATANMGEYRVHVNPYEYYFDDSDDDDDEPFAYGARPYLYEPEYTEEELRERDEREARERQLAEDAAAAIANTDLNSATQPRTSRNWWCTCQRCKLMPAEEECLCCREWDLLRGDIPDTGCVVSTEMFSALTSKAVLDTFFYVPKVDDGSPRPVPEGPGGKLSTE